MCVDLRLWPSANLLSLRIQPFTLSLFPSTRLLLALFTLIISSLALSSLHTWSPSLPLYTATI